MKIACFVDKEGSAIDRLAQMVKKRLPHIEYEVVAYHPKRPSPEQARKVIDALDGADLIDFAYWKTAIKIINDFPELVKGKPKILQHTNEHNIEGNWEWKKYWWDQQVCGNGWQKKKLEEQQIKATLIRLTCEFDHLSFISSDLKPRNNTKPGGYITVGYVGQIKKVKGVRELAEACKQLGYKLSIVGMPSESDYFMSLITEYKDTLIIRQHVRDDEMMEYWKSIDLYCANSDDGTESGTMPILEAMAAGVPVVTRKIGHVRDMGEHGKNMIIREGHYTDIENLKTSLKMVAEDEDLQDEIRENAWRTVRQHHPDIRAREFDRLYRQVIFPSLPIVSIIMPTFDRSEVLFENIKSLKDQTYKNFELVVCDDGSQDGTEALVKTLMQQKKKEGRPVDFPIRYVNTGDFEKYGLAKARNLGIIDCIGDILVFCDVRLKMHQSAIESFTKMLMQRNSKLVWLWGSKGGFKQFVENFSATWRRTAIDCGMFNERIDEYGGMTQEISRRIHAQKIETVFCVQALADPIMTTHSKSGHREEIIRSKIKLYKIGYQ